MSLNGKTSIVTGAGQGIGRAIALCLADEGSNLCIGDINLENAEVVAREIESKDVQALALKVNVADSSAVQAMTEACIEKFGTIDILVNNAGITRDSLLLRMKEEDWDLVMGVNLTGTFNCTRAVLKTMSKQRAGRIVNISSIVGVMGNAGQTNYSASKAGVIGLTKTVAREMASRGITVNAIAPGFIDTEMTRALPEKARETLITQIPLARLGTPEDIARCVRFLVSDDASYITGQVIHINGGMYM